jgi:uncharacterized membrane protein
MLLSFAHFVVAQLFVLDPPAGSAAVSTGVQAISPDGTVMGGQLSFPDGRTTGLVATRTRGTVVVTDIGELSGGLDYTSVDALAADGTPFGTAFGTNVVEPGDIDGVQVAFRFANRAFEVLPDLTGGEGTTNVADVSAAGAVVVGASYPRLDGDFLPFVSVGGPAGTAEALPLRAGATRGDARAVSDDGRRIVCSDDLVTGGLALGYLVERAGDTWVLGADLPFSPFDVSGDGRVVVGARQRGENVVAVRLRVDTPEQVEELGELSGGIVSSEALATSEDGSVVVGRSASGVLADDPSSEEATWSGADGVLRRLADVATERGIDLSALDGGLLSQATAVSADGLVVAGNAWIGPPGRAVVRGFVVVLPPVDDDDAAERADDGAVLHPPPTGCCSEGAGSPAALVALALLLGRRRRRA